jgi:hypothetical protein
MNKTANNKQTSKQANKQTTYPTYRRMCTGTCTSSGSSGVGPSSLCLFACVCFFCLLDLCCLFLLFLVECLIYIAHCLKAVVTLDLQFVVFFCLLFVGRLNLCFESGVRPSVGGWFLLYNGTRAVEKTLTALMEKAEKVRHSRKLQWK